MSMLHTLKALVPGMLLVLSGCGGGGGGGGGPVTGVFELTVFEADGTTAIEGARVSIFNETGSFVATTATNIDGDVAATLPIGVYTARVEAQGFVMSPPQGIAAVPFTVIAGSTVSSSITLAGVADPAALASISGNADIAGALIVARDPAQDLSYSSLSDSNGNYMLFNVAPGDYSITAYKAGYSANSVYIADVVALDEETAADLNVIAYAGTNLSGHITFLAVANGTVDVTLLHPDTRDAIPGLSTSNIASLQYSLPGVPDGSFIAWASFANDGYVMDPDWVNKNGGYPDALVVNTTGGTLTKDFSVTGAIELASPTNPADEVIPVVVETLTPTFRWLSYPSTQQYVVEVFDLNGNSVWGGYDFDEFTADDYNFRHPAIGTALQAQYNFDASAAQPLIDGGIYLWRAYAFKRSGGSGPWVAISTSEEQMGLFRVNLPPPPT